MYTIEDRGSKTRAIRKFQLLCNPQLSLKNLANTLLASTTLAIERCIVKLSLGEQTKLNFEVEMVKAEKMTQPIQYTSKVPFSPWPRIHYYSLPTSTILLRAHLATQYYDKQLQEWTGEVLKQDVYDKTNFPEFEDAETCTGPYNIFNLELDSSLSNWHWKKFEIFDYFPNAQQIDNAESKIAFLISPTLIFYIQQHKQDATTIIEIQADDRSLS